MRAADLSSAVETLAVVTLLPQLLDSFQRVRHRRREA